MSTSIPPQYGHSEEIGLLRNGASVATTEIAPRAADIDAKRSSEICGPKWVIWAAGYHHSRAIRRQRHGLPARDCHGRDLPRQRLGRLVLARTPICVLTRFG